MCILPIKWSDSHSFSYFRSNLQQKYAATQSQFSHLGLQAQLFGELYLAREFEAGGFIRVGVSEAADISVINSCSVTEHADKKCRNLIRKLHRRNPGAIIAVTGCYAQLKPQEIAAIEGVDIVVGNNDKAI